MIALGAELLTTSRAFFLSFDGAFETVVAENMSAVGGNHRLAVGLDLRYGVHTDGTRDALWRRRRCSRRRRRS